MPVRVRVRLRSGSVVVVSALLNTGFTSDELDIHVPRGLAEKLGLWPPPGNASLEVLDTAGGEVLSYFIPNAVELVVVDENDVEVSRRITCNVIVSLHEREVLLSDAVIEELGIEIISPKTGLWRFRGESRLRRSA